MSTTKIFTRISQKHDLEVNWLKAENFVPMQGELIIYDIEVDADGNTLKNSKGSPMLPEGRTKPYTYERFKIGDGIKTITELPFANNININNGAGENSLQQTDNTANGDYSFAEGYLTNANIDYSHAEGYKTETLAKAYKIASINEAIITLEDNGELLNSLISDGIVITNTDGDYQIKNPNLATTFFYYNPKDKLTHRYANKITAITTMDTHTQITLNANPTVDTFEDEEGVEYTETVLSVNDYILIDGGAYGNVDYIAPSEMKLTSHAEGSKTKAYINAHAENLETEARGYASHAEGRGTIAHGVYSHVQGYYSKAIGNNSSSEGSHSESIGGASHAEGGYSKAIGTNSHSEGYASEARGEDSHAEGYFTVADKMGSHAEGYLTEATGVASHAEGKGTSARHNIASGEGSHAEGNASQATHIAAHAEGQGTTASGAYSHAEGIGTKAQHQYSHAGGRETVTGRNGQTVIGTFNKVESEALFVVGKGADNDSRSNAHTLDINGNGWFAGDVTVGANKEKLITEKTLTTITTNNLENGGASHSIQQKGYSSSANPPSATGAHSVALGVGTVANNAASMAVNYRNKATGVYSFAEGRDNDARGHASHAEGRGTIAAGEYQHVQGKYNVVDEDKNGNALNTYAHIVGNGNTATGKRSNAYTLDWNGNGWFAGGVKVGGADQNNAKTLATEDYVKEEVANLVDSSPEALNTLNELAKALGNDPNFAATVVDMVSKKANSEDVYTKEEIGSMITQNVDISQLNTDLDFRSNGTFSAPTVFPDKGIYIRGYVTFSLQPCSAYDCDVYIDGKRVGSTDYNNDYNPTVFSGYVEHSITFCGGGSFRIYNFTISKFDEINSRVANIGSGIGENSLQQVNNTASSKQSFAEGYNTEARIPYSHTEGYDTKTLAKAYKINSVNITEETLEDNTKKITAATVTFVDGTTLITDGVKDDMNISILNESKYLAKILKVVNENTISLNINHSPTISTINNGVLVANAQVMIDGGAFGNEDYQFINGVSISSHAEGRGTRAYVHGHAEGRESEARGHASHAEGRGTVASGEYSHAEGYKTIAKEADSHAEGDSSKANGDSSHAEGHGTIAYGNSAHAEGYTTTAGSIDGTGKAAHAEGLNTIAEGNYSHAEGDAAKASGEASHAEGRGYANKRYSHAEGFNTYANGEYSHTEGWDNISVGDASHTEGKMTVTQSEVDGKKYIGKYAHAEGLGTKAGGESSHTEGDSTVTTGYAAHAEGYKSKAYGIRSHAEGDTTTASGNYSHAEGSASVATGSASHAEGAGTIAGGDASHTEGYQSTTKFKLDNIEYIGKYAHAEGLSTGAGGEASHTEGDGTVATGNCAHAEGYKSKAYGLRAHAEGNESTAKGLYSHAEGYGTLASGEASHAEGYSTEASGNYSHAGGLCTISSNEAQTALGKYNAEDLNALFIVGNGTGTSDDKRSNAFTVDTSGNAVFAGTISTSTISDLNKVIEDLQNRIAALENLNYLLYKDNN